MNATLPAWTALIVYAFVASITPGPNNLMIAASGMHFGVRRSLPHLLGISVGFGAMLLVCSEGVGQLMASAQGVQWLLKIGACAYLLYLAWGVRDLRVVRRDDAAEQPMGFWGAAMFQFVNPKAWVMAITGTSAYLPLEARLSSILVLCVLFMLVNLPCVGVWACAGAAMQRALAQAHWRRAASALMVILTLYAAISIWM